MLYNIGLNYYWVVACHEAATDVVPVLLTQILANLAIRVKERWEIEMFKKVTFGCQEYSLTENSKVDSPIISGGRELTTVSENVQTRPYKLTEWAAERSLSIAGQAVRPQRIWFSLNEHHNCSYVSNVNSIRVLLIIGYAHKKLYSKLGFLAYHLSRTQSVWHSSVLTIINGQEMNLPFFWLFLFCIKILTT